MNSINKKLCDFQYGVISCYPWCLPVVSAVPATLALVTRVAQTALGLLGTVIFAVGSAFSDKSHDLMEKSVKHLRYGAIGMGLAVLQIIPGGALAIRFVLELIGASLKG